MGNKGRGEKTKMNKGRREGQGERANNNKEFSYVFVWCLFRSLIGPKSGQNPKKKKHPNLQPHNTSFPPTTTTTTTTTTMDSGVRQISSEHEITDTIRNKKDQLIVIDYYADWCGPCRRLAPRFDEWSRQYPQVIFLKVNVDQVQGTKVQSLPTIDFFKGGQKVGQVIGARVDQIASLLQQHGQAPPTPAFAGSGRSVGGAVEEKKKQVKPDDDLIETLVEMGFPENRAGKALRATGNSLDGAIAWLAENEEDDVEMEGEEKKEGGAPLSNDFASAVAASLASAILAQQPQQQSQQPEPQQPQQQQPEPQQPQPPQPPQPLQPLTPEEIKKQQEVYREKLREKNKERSKQEVVSKGEKKKKEIEVAKKMTEQREKWKQEQRDRDIQAAQKERREEEERKRLLKKQLEWDKKERMSSQCPVGTLVGNSSPLPTPSPTPTTPPKADAATTSEIQIRFPNGKKTRAQFRPDDTLQVVYDFVAELEEGKNFFPFVLGAPCPRRKFEGEEVRMTLREAGLHPRAVLLVQKLY